MKILSALFTASLLLVGCSEAPPDKAAAVKATASVDIHIAIDPEVRTFVENVTDKFKQSGVTLSDGTRIVPKFIEIPGSLGSDQIASGKLKVDGWITQRSLVELTNVNIRNLGAKQIDCIPLFATPIVFAAAKGTAQTLNLETAALNIKTLVEYEDNNQTLGRTSFLFSDPARTSEGLHALVQLTQIASESTELYDFIFSSTAGYNSSSNELLKRITGEQTPHRHLVVTSERALARYNSSVAGAPLVALYPSAGSVWHDFQLCRSDVEWVNASKQAAIKTLGNFFAENGKSIAQSEGFRPARAQDMVPASSLLTASNGVTISFPTESVTPATASTLQKILKKWELQKRPLSLVFVLDTSGSLEETGLGHTIAAVQSITSRLSLNDMMSLVTVSTDADVALEPTSDRNAFHRKLATLESIGGTALYDGILKGVQLGTRRSPPEYRSVVIAIGDGPDKNSTASQELIRHSVRQALINRDIPLYFVTITDAQSDFSSLKAIAPEMYGTVVATDYEKLSKTLENIWEQQ